MDYWKFFIYLCILVFLSHADEEVITSDVALEDPKICKRIVNENVTVVLTEMVPYQESKLEWCAAFPPRCRKTVIRLKAVNKTEVQEKSRVIQECCDGYEKNKEDLCIPKISNEVIAPQNKLCHSGWTGEYCDEPCSDGLWGINCQTVCKCQNESKCRKYDGQCLCESGFTGEFCEQKCPEGFYGNNCIEACNCSNLHNFQCHHAYGCICADGFGGLSCEKLDKQK